MGLSRHRFSGVSIAGLTVAIGLAIAPFMALAEPPPQAPVLAVDPSDAPPLPIRADWTRMAAYDDLARLYPTQAMAKKLSGEVKALCLLTDDGKLANCKILSEQPAGEGFGAATLEALKLYRARRVTPEGAPVAGFSVEVAVRWRPDAPRYEGPVVAVTRPPVPTGPSPAASPASTSPRPFIPPAPPPMIVPNDAWARMPTAAELGALYPRAALQGKIGGHTAMRCTIGPAGELLDCVVIDERPAFNGFAAAALAAARFYRVNLKAGPNGPSVGGRVMIPLRWGAGPLNDDSDPPPTGLSAPSPKRDKP